MHKTQKRRVFLAIGILCCFMLELVSGPRLHSTAISSAGQQKETGFLIQKANPFGQYTLTDETGRQVSSPLTVQNKNQLACFSFAQFRESIKNTVAANYSGHNYALLPSYINTVIVFPFHYFW